MPKICLYFLKNTNEYFGFQNNLTQASEWSLNKWVSLAEEEMTILHIWGEKISHDDKTCMFPTNKWNGMGVGVEEKVQEAHLSSGRL